MYLLAPDNTITEERDEVPSWNDSDLKTGEQLEEKQQKELQDLIRRSI